MIKRTSVILATILMSNLPVVLVGCGGSQQSALPPEVEPAEPVAVATKPEPTTAKALYKIEDRQGLLGHWKFE